MVKSTTQFEKAGSSDVIVEILMETVQPAGSLLGGLCSKSVSISLFSNFSLNYFIWSQREVMEDQKVDCWLI